MPVIRGRAKGTTLTDDQRKTLLEALVNERAGKSSPEGPVIYEIPLELSDRVDILVVWDAFRDLRSEDRSALILEAYKDQTAKIAQSLGVTRQEALEQFLLPYDVKAFSRFDNVNKSELHKAMLDEGGFTLGDGKIALRFPTWAMAEEASLRLMQRVPEVQCCVEQAIS